MIFTYNNNIIFAGGSTSGEDARYPPLSGRRRRRRLDAFDIRIVFRDPFFTRKKKQTEKKPSRVSTRPQHPRTSIPYASDILLLLDCHTRTGCSNKNDAFLPSSVNTQRTTCTHYHYYHCVFHELTSYH